MRVRISAGTWIHGGVESVFCFVLSGSQAKLQTALELRFVLPTVITPINKRRKCISQNFASYTILLAASSAGADSWYVVVTPRRVFLSDNFSRFAHGRPP